MGFHFFFRNAGTYSQYLKHLRFAHHLLRLEVTWYSRSVKQVEKGISKIRPLPKARPSLLSGDVKQLMRVAYLQGDYQFPMICCVARLFMLRVPSECLALEIQGEHSSVGLEGDAVTLTLFSRKNSRRPAIIRRSCVCTSEGKLLCAVCALIGWCRDLGAGDQLFDSTKYQFSHSLQFFAAVAGLPNAEMYGSHALRRGMAQDIMKAGGSLATQMRAGQWSSGAYRAYLQNHVLEEDAIAQLLIDHSDDEAM